MATPARKINPRKVAGPTPVKRVVRKSAAARPRMTAAKLSVMQETLVALDDAKVEASRVSDTANKLAAVLVEQMTGAGVRKVTAENNGMTVDGTVVHGSRDTVDEQKLKKMLGAALWTKVSSTHLDDKKLQAFIASGEVDPQIVAKCMTTAPIKPYVRVTRK